MTDSKEIRVFCPRCRVQTPWQGNPHRPFCSEKCRLVDLGRWASEEYRVAGPPADPLDPGNVVEFPTKKDES